MYKYQRLEELRSSYWGKLDYMGKNYSNVLVALETACMLPVSVCNSVVNFTDVWADQSSEAKDILRDIHKNSVGFEPFEVLNMVRLIQEFRMVGTKLPIKKFASDLVFTVSDMVANSPLYKDVPESFIASAKSIFMPTYMTKHRMFALYLGKGNDEAYKQICTNFQAEAEKNISEMNGGIAGKSPNQMQVEQRFCMHGCDLVCSFMVLSNTMNYRMFNRELTNVYLKGLMEYLDIPPTLHETLIEASIELVEIENRNQQVQLDFSNSPYRTLGV